MNRTVNFVKLIHTFIFVCVCIRTLLHAFISVSLLHSLCVRDVLAVSGSDTWFRASLSMRLSWESLTRWLLNTDCNNTTSLKRQKTEKSPNHAIWRLQHCWFYLNFVCHGGPASYSLPMLPPNSLDDWCCRVSFPPVRARRLLFSSTITDLLYLERSARIMDGP